MQDDSLQAQMRKHIETCTVCTKQKACDGLLALHAEFLNKDLHLSKQAMQPSLPDTFYYYFNPQCKHDRTSYDTMNCNACIAYSNQMHKNRVEAMKADNAS